MDKKMNDLLKAIDYLPLIGDSGIDFDIPKLESFLDTAFGIKRLLIIRVSKTISKVKRKLAKYCCQKNLEFSFVDGTNLTVDSIKGEPEVISADGGLVYQRKKPDYISDNKQMIIIENLGETTDIGVLRAFCYMAFLGSYYDRHEELPENKLPNGSAYVFIAGNSFPLERFASISGYWNDEAAIIDLREFQTKVWEHMGQYKTKVLNLPDPVSKTRNGKVHSYDHIIPRNKRELNILEPYRKEYSTIVKGKTLHKDFHHLNSSQAMCFNFFYPLIKENALDVVLEILGHTEKTKLESACFEKKVDNIDTQEGTNFDFYLETISGLKFFFEIKYTENGFGTAKKDDSHLNKYCNVYAPIVATNPAISDTVNQSYFLEHYQIMRNLIHIAKDCYVVFIYPKENVRIRKSALAMKNIIEKDWKDHFILLTWKNLIQQVKERIRSNSLIEHLTNFEQKYLEY